MPQTLTALQLVNRFSQFMVNIWNLLTLPHPKLTDRVERRKAHILSATLGALALPGLISIYLLIFHGEAASSELDENSLAIPICLLFMAMVAYGFSRSPYSHYGAILFVTAILVCGHINIALLNTGVYPLYYSILLFSLGHTISCLLFSLRTTTMLAFSTNLMLLTLPFFSSTYLYIDILQPFCIFLIISVLGIAMTQMWHREADKYEEASIKLTENESILSALFENTQDAIWSIDRSYRLLTLSSIYQTQFALAYGKILETGNSCIKALPEKLRPRWQAFYDRVLAGDSFMVEDFMVFDQRRVDLEISFNPIFDKSQRIIGASIFSRNITEQRQARRAARNNRKKYRAAIEQSTDCILLVDVNSRKIIETNPALCRLLGYQHHELARMSIYKVITDDPTDIKRGVVSRKETNHYFSGELSYRRKDGRLINVTARSTVVSSAGRNILYIVARDLTPRRRAEDGRRNTEEKYRTLVENMQEGVILVDKYHRVQFVNDRICELFAVNKEHIIGQKALVSLFVRHAFDISGDDEFLATRREPHQYELKICNKMGKMLWVEVSAVPLFTESGERRGAFGILSNITLRKETQAVLEQAKNAAEDANKAKGMFLANMTHELRTPMNAIIGMTELAMQEPLTDEQFNNLAMVKDSAELLLKMHNDILDISKLEAGKMVLELIRFDLRDAIYAALTHPICDAEQKGLKFKIDIDKQIPATVIGDPLRLRQILTHLLNNAVKFTPRGEIKLTVREKSKRFDNLRVQFSISDTGIGIPASKQKVIFGTFIQADSSTTRRFGGTGLGLSIAHQLIKKMNGTISVESEKDKGSTFHLTVCFRGIADQAVAHLPSAPEQKKLCIIE